MQLRRQRFSSLQSFLPSSTRTRHRRCIYFWPRSYYQPSAGSGSLVRTGTESLRNGAYYQASKALTQATESMILCPGSCAFGAGMGRTRLLRARKRRIDRRGEQNERSSLSPKDALYLDAIRASVTRKFGDAINSYTELAKQFHRRGLDCCGSWVMRMRTTATPTKHLRII